MAKQDPLIGSALGKYQVVELLGKGGMATVYRGMQASINRTVAIKVLPRSFMHDDTFMERFRREAETIASLEHFHILPIYDYGEYDGMPYIVMRLLGGGTVQDIIKQGPMEWQLITKILTQIASALDYAHARGVIHRDIKPSNVMLDGDNNAYLADFGIARVLEGTAQLTGSGIVGTPAYMAPEQSETSNLTPAADIYALGITTYEMITGQLPFQAETPIGQMMMHLTKPVPSILGINPDFPEEVDDALSIAMAKRPEERFKTSTEFANVISSVGQSSGGWGWDASTLAALPSLRDVYTTREAEAIYSLPSRYEASRPGTAPEQRRTPKQRKTRPQPRIGNTGLLIAGLLVVAIITGIGIGYIVLQSTGRPLPDFFNTGAGDVEEPAAAEVLPTETAVPTETQAPTPEPVEDTEQPTEEPTATEIPTSVVEPTPLPDELFQFGSRMIRIPAGSFIMGVGNNEGYPDARPSHEVILSDFFIDETEVTNALYKLCVDNSVCPEPEFTGSPSRVSYYGAEPFNEYPMIYLSWDEAQEYCQWRGGHLPTEAQWEKAARWDPATNTSRMFPWSHGSLDQFYLNFDSLFGDTRAVKSYPEGASAYGLFDMAGNVKEWVYDWYDPNYYAVSPAEDPPGPDSGQFKVLRGGSYESKGSGVSTTFREYIGPGTKLATVGFRCAFTPSGGPSND